MVKNKGIKPILELSAAQAKKYFLKEESYCNFDLPTYFKFEGLLKEIDKKLGAKKLSNFYNGSKPNRPRDFENVNHSILNNKDGKYAWRPFQLIHPIIYVYLVNTITAENNWNHIQDLFKKFKSNKKISCFSIPLKSVLNTSDKAEQIKNWWNSIEQKSLELALSYQYIIKTDITDCYSSFYTHSIAWALHGKEYAKANKGVESLIGNAIDLILQDMHHGQTNGIPQGSTLMDFIAEIVLGYADSLLSERLESEGKNNNYLNDYYILRYRDDYSIFVNNPIAGEIIIKILCEILSSLGLKLHPEKTSASNDIIKESLKKDKLYWLNQKQSNSDIQKHLLIIHTLARLHPNSGSLITALTSFYHTVISQNKVINHVEPLLGIIVDIAQKNPRAYPNCAAIISFLISKVKSKRKKIELIDKIHHKFHMIPNTGHLEIWLQRISLQLGKKFTYNEKLCNKVTNNSIHLWESSWLNNSLINLINNFNIIDNEVLESLPEIVEAQEVDLFYTKSFYY
ncbi:RNA-directed DNA polymerase [Legionella pneumophila serogroup 1]